VLKNIHIRVKDDFELYNHDLTELAGQVFGGEIYIAELHELTEEYFIKDHKDREIPIGSYDFSGNLNIEDSFEQLISKQEE